MIQTWRIKCVGGERREEYGLIDIEAGVGF